MRGDRAILAFLIGFPTFIVGIVLAGLFLYEPLLYAVPGFCIGFIGWTMLFFDVVRHGLDG